MKGIRGPGFPLDCPETVPEVVVNQSKAESRKKKKEADSQDENQMATEQSRIEEGSMSN